MVKKKKPRGTGTSWYQIIFDHPAQLDLTVGNDLVP